MKAILILKDQWDVIEEMIPDRPTTEWKKTNQKALATILLLVNDSELTHIEDCEDAADAWTRLAEVFEAKGIMRRVLLKRNLLSIRLEDSGSMQDYINEVTKITRQLKEIGAPVSDEDVALTLLIGLPETFDHLITSLEVQDKDLSTHYVQGILLQHEARHNKGISDSKAFLAKRKNMDNKPNKSIKCFHCGKLGHKSPECRKRLAEEKAQANTMKPDVEDNIYTAFILAKAARSNDSSWCIDSGATQHITSNKESLSTYEILEPPRKIYLADNHIIMAKGIGNIPLQLIVNGKMTAATLHEVLHAPDIHDNLISVDRIV